jgi:hypothetical protein
LAFHRREGVEKLARLRLQPRLVEIQETLDRISALPSFLALNEERVLPPDKMDHE